MENGSNTLILIIVVFILAAATVGVMCFVRSVKRRRRCGVMDEMKGHDFEYFCADLLERQGFVDVEVPRGTLSGDGRGRRRIAGLCREGLLRTHGGSRHDQPVFYRPGSEGGGEIARSSMGQRLCGQYVGRLGNDFHRAKKQNEFKII